MHTWKKLLPAGTEEVLDYKSILVGVLHVKPGGASGDGSSATAIEGTTAPNEYAVRDYVVQLPDATQSEFTDLHAANGENKYFWWNLGTPLKEDFVFGSRVALKKPLSGTACGLTLDDFFIGLDGSNNVFFTADRRGGNLKIYGPNTLMKTGQEYTVAVRRRDGRVTLIINDGETPIKNLDFPNPVSKLSWRPHRMTMGLKDMWLERRADGNWLALRRVSENW